MAGLLVSVRSPQEAEAALAGGAAIIDVKEPSRGALGRADDDAIAAIIAQVAGRRPVSAAMGELVEDNPPYLGPGLTFLKWGLAGSSWVRTPILTGTHPEVVVVAYADWQCAQAPPVEDVVTVACQSGGTLLIDTHCKTPTTVHKRRPTLLDWITRDEVFEVCRRCRNANVRVALAGSLTMEAIEQLRAAEPTWFAVRGAVCSEGDRDAAVVESRVRQLTELLG